MILRGAVYPRSICPRGHMVLGPHVWGTSPPRTGSPVGHVEGGGGFFNYDNVTRANGAHSYVGSACPDLDR